jgi:hypothetical protein
MSDQARQLWELGVGSLGLVLIEDSSQGPMITRTHRGTRVLNDAVRLETRTRETVEQELRPAE